MVIILLIFQEKFKLPKRRETERKGNEAEQADDPRADRHQRYFCRFLAAISSLDHSHRYLQFQFGKSHIRTPSIQILA